MKLAFRSLVLVHRRLHDLAAKPRLFFDAMPPARVAARRDRVRAWCGPGLWRALEDELQRNYLPTGGGHLIGRSIKPKERRAVTIHSVGHLNLADASTGTRTGVIDVCRDEDGNVHFRVNRRGAEVVMRLTPDIARQTARLLDKAAGG